MKKEVSQIVGISEIALFCGASRQAVSNWERRNPDFPEPIHILKMGPLYYWPQIERWLVKHEKIRV